VGAAEHNLKSISLRIPKNRFIVFSGVSGSGKSSLAFDTIYVEGQRKYIESLSSYARQFLGQLERPRYERMSGLSPTIAIEQKTSSANPRSTVGTVTEILDYLRVLFARAGDQRCPTCMSAVGKQDAQQVVATLLASHAGKLVTVAAPVARQRKGEYRQQLEELMRQGFVRFRIDGEILRLDEPVTLEKNRKHDIDIVVDRVKAVEESRQRLTDSVETALKAGKGRMVALLESGDLAFSEALYCDRCNVSLPELTPQLFSFNSPLGACPACHGLGVSVRVDMDRFFHPQGARLYDALNRLLVIWVGRRRGWRYDFWHRVQKELGISPDVRVSDLPEADRQRIVYGNGAEGGRFPGLWDYIQKDLDTTSSDAVRAYYYTFFVQSQCRACGGTRLRPEARSVLLSDASISTLTGFTVERLAAYFRELRLVGHREAVAASPTREILARLRFLEDVGLGYLTLDRAAHTLSGGEAQRIRLARQLGSELAGVIYILDEPSVGLHQRDGLRLVQTLERLRDLGNTILVVEHDRETVEHADYIVDFGKGAGRDGGEVVYAGDLVGLLECPDSLTGGYLSGRLSIEVPGVRRKPSGWLRLTGVTVHNIRELDVEIPLGVFTVVTGVSGAGKSSLVTETVQPAVEEKLGIGKRHESVRFDSIAGADGIDRMIGIDQKPIGRTPRSNPATYTKVFDVIRGLFARTQDARAFGYQAGRFSFNVKGGRCEKCGGDGALKIEMHFLPDVYVTCPQCNGKRFNDATLRVQYKGKTISDVLEMSVDEALDFFSQVPAARRTLKTLADVGLGYMKLGQPSPTLSGGEAQRIKLSRELAKREGGHTLYVLDEPTTGLHFHDVKKLLGVLHRLADAGHSVLMVEHNMEIIKSADWVIDMGPEGGDAGGRIVVAGTPEEVAAFSGSYTGRFLRPALKRGL
jgi:excinuclease ABC subunit A